MPEDDKDFEDREFQSGEELTRTIVSMMPGFSERNVIYALTQSLAVALHLSTARQTRDEQIECVMRKVAVFLDMFRDPRQVDNLTLN